MLRPPFQPTISFSPPRKIIPQPSLNLPRFRDLYPPILRVDLHSPRLLDTIPRCLVVQHGIPHDFDPQTLRGADEEIQVFATAPFRASSPLLVEFTEIPDVVAVVAVASGRVGFTAGREPESGDAEGVEGGEETGQTRPVGGWRGSFVRGRRVRSSVPFEGLEDDGIVLCTVGHVAAAWLIKGGS